ncbi:4-hydroxy-tetrahydrodipicolinate reductase [Ornithinimicrobium sp. LYQ92]|uniref:4-hydroxy-tetrahydrodipicolinate reductase n=1 Tax=Serinicoccus sp. LYQ92 TaxID=3378798 RepID=UPI003853A7C5
MPTSIGLLGTGRLGTAVRRLADDRDDVQVAWAVGRGPVPQTPVDVAIDVSTAQAVAGHLDWARRTGTDLVIGTTGWDTDLLSAPETGIRVLVAPNFSLGVALVSALVRALGGYADTTGIPTDLAVTETHHRHKVDSPSGTALALRDAVAHGAGQQPDRVQTTSLRLGEVVGDHEVSATSALETISVRHTAHDRDLFAHGALDAALWLAARPAPGTYTLDDLAQTHLRTLLDPPQKESR